MLNHNMRKSGITGRWPVSVNVVMALHNVNKPICPQSTPDPLMVRGLFLSVLTGPRIIFIWYDSSTDSSPEGKA